MKVDINVEDGKYDVQIDSSDLWSLDFTLSQIIYPALVKFKEEETGHPAIDKEDVPEYLHSTYGTKSYEQNSSHEAWIWLLDEMIWAFGQKACDNGDEPTKLSSPAYNAYHERQQNAFRLFGKYLRCLWN
jgi:hypothetical protein